MIAIYRIKFVLIALAFHSALFAQDDDRVAYVPSKHIARTADDHRMGLKEGAVIGTVEFQMPEGTFQVDLINSRGTVKKRRSGAAMGQLDLGSLRTGTWTLRAHTIDGMIIRRFVVLQHGRIAWAVPTAIRSN